MFGLIPYSRKNNSFTRIFDDFLSEAVLPQTIFNGTTGIRSDIRETEKEYIIDAEIPGAKKEDIKLELRDDVLTIKFEQKTEDKEKTEKYIRKEIRYGSVCRSYYVNNVDNEKVTAKYENGILSVTLPKSEGENTNKHQIDIQ